MYNYEQDNNYIDEEKKSRVPFFVFLIILIVVILAIVISCGVKPKDKNNNLGYLKVMGATISPNFDKNNSVYIVNTTSDLIKISCGAESTKSKVEGCNKEIKVSFEKSNYIIKVTAENGDLKKYTLNISNDKIETKKLSVSIESDIKSGEKTTKEEVKLNAKLSEDASVKYEWYKNGVKISNEIESILIVKESASYSVKVINGNDTISSNDFIVNIEKNVEKPKVTKPVEQDYTSNKFVLKIDSITGNSTSWVKKVTLKVNVTSSNEIIGYSFDGGKTYQKSNTKTFTNNQKVKIVIKDKSGKTVTEEVIISKVDSTIPKVAINHTDKVSKSINLYATINPGNVPSGYKYKWYKNGKVIENANSLTYKATSAGTYKFEVITGSGIVASDAYTFTPAAITCPTLLVTDSTGKAVKNNTWINDHIFIKITPSKETVSYNVYLNESGHFDSINKNFVYYNTFDTSVKIKILNGGVRTIKLVIKDINGNQNVCYSKNYYLK